MYTIKQAAARSGLSVPTVRVWERRYGVVHPDRTATGYRLYDDEAIERLMAMRHLVEHDGMRPSQAAGRILSAETDIADLVRQANESSPAAAVPPGVGRSLRAVDEVEAFVGAAARLDVPTMERILDEAFAAERFEAAVEHLLFPALRAIGDRWEQGSMDVAAEHAASETVRRRLARFYDSVASTGAPDVMVGLPPGAHHEIGALVFAVAARRRGLDVLYLGADVPLQSWRTAAETSHAPVAVVGVVAASDVESAGAVIETLGDRPPATTVVVGGKRAHEVVGATGSMLLPGPIDDAVDAVQGWLSRPTILPR